MVDFPLSPISGDTYTENGVKYTYTGSKWTKAVSDYSYKGSAFSVSNNQCIVDLSRGNIFTTTLTNDAVVTFVNPITSGPHRFSLEVNISTYPSSQTWAVNLFSYNNVSVLISSQDGNPRGIFFKDDGTKMYMVGANWYTVFQYNLSIPWVVSSAVSSDSFYVGEQDTAPQSVFFKPDGTKMYVVGNTNNRVFEYNLSTPWDVITAVYSISFDVSALDSLPYGIFFDPSGTKMFLSGYLNNRVYQYSLSTPWNISSAVYSTFFSVAVEANVPYDIFFKPDGTRMYVLSGSNDSIHQYNLSVAWSVSSAVYSSSVSVASQDITPGGIFFKPDGAKMFASGSSTDRVYEYTIPSPILTWPDNVIWETGSAPTLEYNQTSVLEFFTSDGGTTYYGAVTSEDVN